MPKKTGMEKWKKERRQQYWGWHDQVYAAGLP